MSVDPIIKETQINIIIDINISGEKPFSLTKNVLHNDNLTIGDFSEYPYFSSSIPYPKSILNELDYNSQVAFFFKKENFLNTIKQTSEYKNAFKILKKNKETEELNQKIKFAEKIKKIKKAKAKATQARLVNGGSKTIQDSKQKNKIIKENIMLMLTLLFPTNYPLHNNVFNSYDSIFSNMSSVSSLSSIMPFLLSNLLGIESTKQKYSYINSPSKGICTVTQVIWLNDLYNHPEYKKIVENYDEFQKWKIKETTKLNDEITKEINVYGSVYGIGLKELQKILTDNATKTIIESSMTNMQRSNIRINLKNEFKEFLENLKIIISNLNNLVNFIPNLIKFKRTYENIRRYIETQLSTIKKFNISSLIQSITKVELNYEIINKYLDISIVSDTTTNLTSEERDLQQRVQRWDGYKKYNEFMNLLKLFKRPTNESSNLELQEVIEDYLRGNTENEFEILMYPANSKSSDIKNLVETGMSIKPTEPKNTINVRMDVIAGVLNDGNKKEINCSFNEQYLGNELDRLLKTTTKFWELDPNRFLFELNTTKQKTNGGARFSYKKNITVKNHRK